MKKGKIRGDVLEEGFNADGRLQMGRNENCVGVSEGCSENGLQRGQHTIDGHLIAD